MTKTVKDTACSLAAGTTDIALEMAYEIIDKLDEAKCQLGDGIEHPNEVKLVFIVQSMYAFMEAYVKLIATAYNTDEELKHLLAVTIAELNKVGSRALKEELIETTKHRAGAEDMAD